VPCEFVTDSFVHFLELSQHDFLETVAGYPRELREEIASLQVPQFFSLQTSIAPRNRALLSTTEPW